MMESFTTAFPIISSSSCVTTTASPQNFLTVLYKYKIYPPINLLAIALLIGGFIRIFNAFMLKPMSGWGWTLFSGLLTLATGAIILASPDSPFWVLGLFLGVDILFQGVNYLTFAAAIKQIPPASH